MNSYGLKLSDLTGGRNLDERYQSMGSQPPMVYVGLFHYSGLCPYRVDWFGYFSMNPLEMKLLLDEDMKEKQLIEEVTRLRYDVEELKREAERLASNGQDTKWYEKDFVIATVRIILFAFAVSVILLFGLLSMQ